MIDLIMKIMHTYLDDLVRWLYTTFLNRDWTWPVATDDTKKESGQ
jgi:hypothetical protein